MLPFPSKLFYSLVLTDNWEPGIVSDHCQACIAGESGKYRVQEFKDNAGGVLVLLKCTSTTATPTVHIPKLATQTSHCVETDYVITPFVEKSILCLLGTPIKAPFNVVFF